MTHIVERTGIGSNRRALRFLAALPFLSPMAACQTGALSLDQALYDACVDDYNSKFRFKPGNRAMVAGSQYFKTRCYWTWSQPSQVVATNKANANCRKERAICQLFADNNGLTRWSKRISNNGGRDPDIGRTYSRPSASYKPYSGYKSYSYSRPSYSSQVGSASNFKVVGGRVVKTNGGNFQIYRGQNYQSTPNLHMPTGTRQTTFESPSWHEGCNRNSNGTYDCNVLYKPTYNGRGGNAVR